jgi:hypothetical protein
VAEMYSPEPMGLTAAAMCSADAQEPVLPACSNYRRCLPEQQTDFAHRAWSAPDPAAQPVPLPPRSTPSRRTLSAADFAYA